MGLACRFTQTQTLQKELYFKTQNQERVVKTKLQQNMKVSNVAFLWLARVDLFFQSE